MAASTGRSNRFAKALERRAQLQEQEKKGKPLICSLILLGLPVSQNAKLQ